MINPIFSIQIFCLLVLSILFLQSGLDKVFNYKGNKEWLESHFAKSPLKNFVGLMVPAITILEVLSGILTVLGLIIFMVNGKNQLAIIGAQLCTLSIISLFFGQRLAQDYAGAATLTTYFLICIATLYVLSL